MPCRGISVQEDTVLIPRQIVLDLTPTKKMYPLPPLCPVLVPGHEGNPQELSWPGGKSKQVAPTGTSMAQQLPRYHPCLLDPSGSLSFTYSLELSESSSACRLSSASRVIPGSSRTPALQYSQCLSAALPPLPQGISGTNTCSFSSNKVLLSAGKSLGTGSKSSLDGKGST